MKAYFNNISDTIQLEVTNVPEFAQLLSKAKMEADQLTKTIQKLSGFTLDFKFSVGSGQEGDMERASSDTSSAPT